MARHSKTPQFRFRKTHRIGAAGAEQDLDTLRACFVDTGDIAILENASDVRSILLGRTGTGKSALIAMLELRQKRHVIRLRPESLALTYIANSDILTFFATIGVNLDPFFKLLWRHVLTVELLQRYYSQRDAADPRSLFHKLREKFAGPSRTDRDMRQALDYLEKWGKNFWQETEYRVKDITSTIETDLDTALAAQLGTNLIKLGGSAGAKEKMTESVRSELKARGQDIVSRAQVQDLQRAFELLDCVFDDPQSPYYVVIDGLDDNWVEDRLRYRLIMALIQTVSDFLHVKNAKLVMALRRDLIERVFRLARDAGFQEEKYQSLYIPLFWTREQILAVLDVRIGHLVSHKYSSKAATHRDVLPKAFRDLPISDYIYSIAPRPRDAISFFNCCIAAAVDQPRLGTQELKIAEGEYSRLRLRALGDEWSADYPELLDFARILQRKPDTFKIELLSHDELEELCLTIVAEAPGQGGILKESARQLVDCLLATDVFASMLAAVFYHVGLVGLKRTPHERASWSDELGRSISAPEIGLDTSIVVHPAYRRALGVREAK